MARLFEKRKNHAQIDEAFFNEDCVDESYEKNFSGRDSFCRFHSAKEQLQQDLKDGKIIKTDGADFAPRGIWLLRLVYQEFDLITIWSY